MSFDIDKGALDRYITGGDYHTWWEDLQCYRCGRSWQVRMDREYGITSYFDEDDAVCPECKANYLQCEKCEHPTECDGCNNEVSS